MILGDPNIDRLQFEFVSPGDPGSDPDNDPCKFEFVLARDPRSDPCPFCVFVLNGDPKNDHWRS